MRTYDQMLTELAEEKGPLHAKLVKLMIAGKVLAIVVGKVPDAKLVNSAMDNMAFIISTAIESITGLKNHAVLAQAQAAHEDANKIIATIVKEGSASMSYPEDVEIADKDVTMSPELAKILARSKNIGES